ncbi:MAG: hypothetical protein P4L22_00085 [Candidatus Babeliales bacterium]|nr:hypothetical protein [Candidatus Babeliales bacterium]
MIKLKNILIAFVMIATSINYCADEAKSLDEYEEKQATSSDTNEVFTLISFDGIKFEIPLFMAKQVPVLAANLRFTNCIGRPSYEFNFGEEIDALTLSIMAYALNTLSKNTILESKKERYDKVQPIFHENMDIINEYFKCFIATYLYFDSEFLIEVFADKLAQTLINDDQTLNLGNLHQLISLFMNCNNTYKKNWHLIEKFYYLRSKNLKPSLKNILLKVLRPDGSVAVAIKIIKRWKLSIDDLIDFKNIKLNKGYKLNLSNFYLSSIQGLRRIPNIENCLYLDLSNNLLIDLSDNLKGLKSLQLLNLMSNQLQTLGDSLHGLNELNLLYLNNNQLIELGDSLNSLKRLHYLNLSNNKLSNLGSSLQGLNKLSTLIITHNRLKDLSNSLHGLNSLQDLYLSNNQLSKIEESLQGLNALRILDLSNNFITSLIQIPNIIFNLIKLRIKNNPLNLDSRDLIANWRAIQQAQAENA